MVRIRTRNEEETLNVGMRIGRNTFFPSLFALVGELGSGKTVLTRGIARGMGITARVKSPTFVFIHEYKAPHPLYHFDLYRLSTLQELYALGYQEYFYTPHGVVVVEWADKIIDFLPSEYLKITILMESLNLRKIVMTPKGNGHYHQLIQRIMSER